MIISDQRKEQGYFKGSGERVKGRSKEARESMKEHQKSIGGAWGSMVTQRKSLSC